MPSNVLRSIPSVGELLDSPPLRGLIDRVSHNAVVAGVRTFLDEVRGELQTAASDRTLPSVTELAERIARRILAEDQPTLMPVINATGQLLHPGLGRAPLAEIALAEMAAVARDYASVDLNLTDDAPTDRDAFVARMLTQLTGAESAMIVNNGAAATMLALAAIAAGREVMVSRSQVIESDDGYRLNDAIALSGAGLCEVGTVNKTRVADFAAAIGTTTAAILLVDTSHEIDTESPRLAELVCLGRKHQVPVLHELGGGALFDYSNLRLGGNPMVGQSIAGGADLVLFPGDRLLGGPECGIVVGRREWIARMRCHPLARVVRADKLTLAALGATLRIYREKQSALDQIPLLQLLTTSLENLKLRASRMAPQMEAAPGIARVEVVEGTSESTEESSLPQKQATWRVALTPASDSAERLAERLRAGHPVVVGRVQDGRVWLDLRTVFPRQDRALVEAVCTAGNGPEEVPVPEPTDA